MVHEKIDKRTDWQMDRQRKKALKMFPIDQILKIIEQ